jgi:hypothetical protein
LTWTFSIRHARTGSANQTLICATLNRLRADRRAAFTLAAVITANEYKGGWWRKNQPPRWWFHCISQFYKETETRIRDDVIAPLDYSQPEKRHRSSSTTTLLGEEKPPFQTRRSRVVAASCPRLIDALVRAGQRGNVEQRLIFNTAISGIAAFDQNAAHARVPQPPHHSVRLKLKNARSTVYNSSTEVTASSGFVLGAQRWLCGKIAPTPASLL